MPDSYVCLRCGAMQGRQGKCLVCGGPVKDSELFTDEDNEQIAEIKGEK